MPMYSTVESLSETRRRHGRSHPWKAADFGFLHYSSLNGFHGPTERESHTSRPMILR